MPHSSLLEANLLGEAIGQAAVDLRHRTEALSESERRFRMFAEQSADMIWFFDVEKNRIEYRVRRLKRSGAAPGRRSPVWRTGAGQCTRRTSPFSTAIARPAHGGAASQIRILRPDGAVRWVRDTRFVLDEAGRQPRIIAGICGTSPKDGRRNKTSPEREPKPRTGWRNWNTLWSSPIGLAVIGQDYRLLRVNEFVGNIKGLAHDAPLGRPFFDVLPEMQSVAEPLFELILGGDSDVKCAEFQTVGPDGRFGSGPPISIPSS